MKFLKTKNSKKALVIMIFVILLSVCITLIQTNYINKKYNKTVNTTILKIVNKVKNQYPNVDDKEIIDVLNESSNYDGSILEKYNYDENISFISKIRKEQRNNVLSNIAIIVTASCTFLLIYIVYLYKENKKIKNINNYLKEINNQNYTLKIEENGSDELSKLQNELYKTTILLRQTANINEKEKIALSNSLADISHQLKTPLTSITIMLDNINDNPDMDIKTRSYFIRQIMKQIDWVNSLVISILKISKFDSGTIVLKNEEINVKKFVNTLISNISVLLDLKDIKIITNDFKGNFFGDFKWQQEAITNILKNAIEHSYEHSKIYLDIENTNLFLKIKIKDEGSGIDKEDIKHLFERFYKSKNSDSSSVGIGLNLAKTIIEKENGSIIVNSKLKEGATFTIKYLKI